MDFLLMAQLLQKLSQRENAGELPMTRHDRLRSFTTASTVIATISPSLR